MSKSVLYRKIIIYFYYIEEVIDEFFEKIDSFHNNYSIITNVLSMITNIQHLFSKKIRNSFVYFRFK